MVMTIHITNFNYFVNQHYSSEKATKMYRDVMGAEVSEPTVGLQGMKAFV